MRIVSKEGNELVLLAITDEGIEKGDYLSIEDTKSKRKMLVQVYDEEYLSIQSLVEDMVKDEVVKASSEEGLHDPHNIGNLSRMIRDARLFRCKIRASIENGRLSSSRLSTGSMATRATCRSRRPDSGRPLAWAAVT